MDYGFEGQVAIVTGGATGIGFDIARQLVASGANVILNDLDPELLRRAAERIDTGDRLITIDGDAGDLKLIKSLVDTAENKFNGLDICVANAGITSYGSFLKFTPASFEQLINLNLKGSFFLAQQAAQSMINRKVAGRILFLSSVTGIAAHPYLAAYGMTKAGLSMLAKALVIELARYGITTNAIAPGAVATERTLSMTPGYAEIWGEMIPTGKVSMPADITRAALFLVSKDAGQINGQTIVVDGGITVITAADEEVDKPEED